MLHSYRTKRTFGIMVARSDENFRATPIRGDEKDDEEREEEGAEKEEDNCAGSTDGECVERAILTEGERNTQKRLLSYPDVILTIT
ncbi:hypothetical protein PRIPAC_90325 [Pristionchus pacificus]|uniref:Uncharacterized protein n=1 Tax=Pristionchus pacificus TaxID=54126 RepID=A0A2A6CZ80_PRIPA|nr:hypothetical protein PRIPAC_90325 [Pristionchus pacificus]|eukprot:PDM83333.1 hypothetical protein PRIPAC_34965 [Pristionchus pacificus]